MGELPQNRNLAYDIGLCRIALVVDRVHRQVKTHPVLAEIFHLGGDWGDGRARLTYFWWVVLGGNKLRAIDLELIAKDVHDGINPDLLKEWFILFHNSAVPVIGEELTRAWMGRAERLARKLGIAKDDHLYRLAKAS